VTQHSRDTPQFYLTAPSPCPYLPGRHERKVFTHLVGDKAGDLNDLLTHGGFRRSQSIAYRPACDQCRACVSVRVVANEFRPSRNFRKILARNADIVGEQRSAVPTSEQYSVFRAYLDRRHRHGGMADMTVLDYAMMVEDSHVETRIIEYRKRGIDTGITGRGEELIAVALTDVLSDGLSMVYSFFEPSEQSRSLGTFMILDHITRARGWGCLTSISATGSKAPRRWTTRAASCRSSGWRRQAGCASTHQAKCRSRRTRSRRISD
jgi:arginyl-tRNA--protein-N-Asp/Glu arginylyltransferase